MDEERESNIAFITNGLQKPDIVCATTEGSFGDEDTAAFLKYDAFGWTVIVVRHTERSPNVPEVVSFRLGMDVEQRDAFLLGETGFRVPVH